MPGAQALSDSPELVTMLRKQRSKGGWYGAICAAPAVALLPHGLLPGQATCHPAFQSKLEGIVDASSKSARVVVDESARCVTSQGAGTAIEFALKLVELVVDEATSQQVAKAIVF
mmetsp:Transcript_16978/g.36895  ORF Transcript_16978/g.36895 Transcript_16978/m.36895 type:complete len:115 (+) Transcript_16978:431-775(+)